MPSTRRRIRLKIRLDADPLKIWDAVVNPRKLSIWFCNRAEVNLKLRGAVHFSGENCAATTFPEKEIKGQILDLDPNRLLKFTWPLAKSESEVTFQIDDRGRGCDFLVTHDRLPERTLMMDAWIIALYNLQGLIATQRPVYRLDYSRLDRGTIRRELFFDVLPPVVYRALTNQRDLRIWFAESAEVEAVVEGKYTTGWRGAGGEPAGPRRILELVENRKLVYDWSYPGETSGDVVSWELLRIGEKTRVTLKHSGFPPDATNKSHTQGWHAYMLILKGYCESGGQVAHTVIEGDWN